MQMKLVANNLLSRKLFFVSSQRRAVDTTLKIIDMTENTLYERLHRFFRKHISPYSDSYSRKRTTLKKWMTETSKEVLPNKNLLLNKDPFFLVLPKLSADIPS